MKFNRLFAAIALFSLSSQAAFALPFSDLDSYQYYFEGVYQNKEMGFVNGYEDGTFRGQNSINRAELAKMLVLGSGVSQEEMELAVEAAKEDAFFTDVSFEDYEDGKWYALYVGYAKTQGWINGYPDGSFKPSDPVNVVEALKMVTEVMHSTPAASFEGDAWYDLYLNYLTNPGVGALVEPYMTDNWLNFRYTSAGLGELTDEVSRAAVAELIYRLQDWSYEPYMSLTDLDAESRRGLNYRVYADSDMLGINDFDYGVYVKFPLNGLDPNDLRLYVQNPSGYLNDYQSEWQILIPDTSGGEYSENGYVVLFGFTVADEIYYAGSGQVPLSEPIEGYAHEDMTSTHGLLYIPYCAMEVPSDLVDIRNAICSGDGIEENTNFIPLGWEECGTEDDADGGSC